MSRRTRAQGAASVAQQTDDNGRGIVGEKTTVRTTLGFEVEADASELVDLQRQGLIATKKDERAAAAAVKAEADAAAEATEAQRAKTERAS